MEKTLALTEEQIAALYRHLTHAPVMSSHMNAVRDAIVTAFGGPQAAVIASTAYAKTYQLPIK
jgi:cystathionine beta-lyase/cystathionine gamma-synthase